MDLLRAQIREDGRIFQFWHQIRDFRCWHGITANIDPMFWYSDQSPVSDLLESLRRNVDIDEHLLRSNSNLSWMAYPEFSSEFRLSPDLEDVSSFLHCFNAPILRDLPEQFDPPYFYMQDVFWDRDRYHMRRLRRRDNMMDTVQYDLNLIHGASKERSDETQLISSIAKELKLNIRLREVGIPQLRLSAGDCVSGGRQGTMGGFLKDRSNGNLYGVTCGHVAGKIGSFLHDNHGTQFSVVDSVEPQPSPAGVVCAPGHTNELDVALIDVNSAAHCSNIASGITKVPHPRVALEYSGASTTSTSSIASATKALSVVQKFHAGTSHYCFEDTIVFKPKLSSILHSSVSRAMVSGPQPGDSGAWLLTSGASGLEWCGLIVGADINWSEGYAIDAQKIIDWQSPHRSLVMY